MHSLYFSHNGMLEALGQSQVLPYLRGLARRGVTFDLLSFERAEAADEDIDRLRGTFDGTGIRWHPLRRRMDPRLRVKVGEIVRGIADALVSAAVRRPDIVHGRSYLPTAIGDVVASIVPRAKLVFDCRGMLGEEYVDAGHWTRDQKEYRLLKRYEARAFRRADGVVVLTHALRDWVERAGGLGPRTTITTIPTCVDLDRFRHSAAGREWRRAELGVAGDELVVVYAGSLSRLYCVPAMVQFVRSLTARAPGRVRFLVLTASDSAELLREAGAAGLSENILVRKARPEDVASYLSAADLGLSFGEPCFARLGCSPTKLAEYLACGLPVVTNGDFGDQGLLVTEPDMCVVLRSLEPSELSVGAAPALDLARQPVERRIARGSAIAEARFGLENVGVSRYEGLYREVMKR